MSCDVAFTVIICKIQLDWSNLDCEQLSDIVESQSTGQQLANGKITCDIGDLGVRQHNR